METFDGREWLLTNGLGTMGSGTVGDARTRTYHGWLVAALAPPGQRSLLLSHLEATLVVGQESWALGTNFWADGVVHPQGYQALQTFEREPVPTWVWQEADWRLTRQIVMPHASPEMAAAGQGVLMRYRYEGDRPAVLHLRPLIGDRNLHHQQHADPDLRFSQIVGSQWSCFQAQRPTALGTPWYLTWTRGLYTPEEAWYLHYLYPEETQRGLADQEDLFCPGRLAIALAPGEAVTLGAFVGLAIAPLTDQCFDRAVAAEVERLASLFAPVLRSPHPYLDALRQLCHASDQFIVHRASIQGPTAIAGYPWFSDWGRDTLIALPGLALTTGRWDLARGLLETFGNYCLDGLIPNTFPETDADPIYNSLDATLWWIETLGLYLEETQDWNFLATQYATVRKIYKSLMAGTYYNICVDASDGLLSWDAPGVALTWMDAVVDGYVVTPRRGKPVEINALWYSALIWLRDWTERLAHQTNPPAPSLLPQADHYCHQASQVEASLQKFWNRSQGYLFDVLAPDDSCDARIRPNAVIALSLVHCAFPVTQGRQILAIARDRLLTPYGLRSLDPSDPDYEGTYLGDRLHRDRAYHQGTVWSWLIGPFARAWNRFYPEEPLPFDWQPFLDHLTSQACLGSVSEIFDGDPPHTPQGAIAQAWSVAEILRSLELGLSRPSRTTFER